jgi:hypothetical protein
MTAKNIVPEGFRRIHLLWTLTFLKLYCSEEIVSAICGCDEKTLRKWVWKGIDALGELNLVRSCHGARILVVAHWDAMF